MAYDGRLGYLPCPYWEVVKPLGSLVGRNEVTGSSLTQGQPCGLDTLCTVLQDSASHLTHLETGLSPARFCQAQQAVL